MQNENVSLLLAFTVGAGALYLGFYKYNQQRRLMNTGIKVKGTVLSTEHSVASQTTTSYHPVVSYKTLQNETITGRYDVGEDKFAYSVGDHVDIIYDTNNNREFIIDDKKTRQIGPLFIVAGAAIMLFVVVQYFFHPFGRA